MHASILDVDFARRMRMSSRSTSSMISQICAVGRRGTPNDLILAASVKASYLRPPSTSHPHPHDQKLILTDFSVIFSDTTPLSRTSVYDDGANSSPKTLKTCPSIVATFTERSRGSSG